MNNDPVGVGFAVGMVGFVFILLVGVYVVSSYFLMRIFDKAGVQGQWRAWVPVYNSMVFFKLGDLSPWLVLYGVGGAMLLSWIGIGAIFSIALTVFSALAAYRVGLKLQKEPVWVVLYVLVPIVWMGILGLDKSRWYPGVAPAPWSRNAFLADNTVWEGIPSQSQYWAQPEQQWGGGAQHPYQGPSTGGPYNPSQGPHQSPHQDPYQGRPQG